MAAVTAEGKKGEEKMRNKPFHFKTIGLLFAFLLSFSVLFFMGANAKASTVSDELRQMCAKLADGEWFLEKEADFTNLGCTMDGESRIVRGGGEMGFDLIIGAAQIGRTSDVNEEIQARIDRGIASAGLRWNINLGEEKITKNGYQKSFKVVSAGEYGAMGISIIPSSQYEPISRGANGFIKFRKGLCGVEIEGSFYQSNLPNENKVRDPGRVLADALMERADVVSKELGSEKWCELLKITLQPTVSPQDNEKFSTGIDIPGYTQALVADLPKQSDFQKIPQSDFKVVYPASTQSANIKDSIFIGKVGGTGKIVVESPNGDKITLTDDMSGIDFFNKRFGATLPGPEMGNPTKLTIREVDCHIIASRNDSGNCDSSGRCIYPDIWDAQTRIEKTVGDCTYLSGGGPVRVLAEQGQVTLKTPGSVTATASKADFGIAYDAKSGTSAVEVYNGSVTVTNKAGQSKKISTVYGSQINRIEVNKDGKMTEKIAIPQSEWEAFLASQQEKEIISRGNLLPIAFAIMLLGAGGIIFFLYRKGKLIPLYKTHSLKISELRKKISKNNKQQDSA